MKEEDDGDVIGLPWKAKDASVALQAMMVDQTIEGVEIESDWGALVISLRNGRSIRVSMDVGISHQNIEIGISTRSIR